MAQTHPPLDPELGAALDAAGDHFPALTSVDMIPTMRAAIATYAVSDDDLRRNGAIEFDERSIPGPAGAPDLSVLICRPAGLSTLAPGVYHTHGGGMIMGDNRVGLATFRWIGWRSSGWSWSRSSTGWRRRTPIPFRSRTATPPRPALDRRPHGRDRHRRHPSRHRQRQRWWRAGGRRRAPRPRTRWPAPSRPGAHVPDAGRP